MNMQQLWAWALPIVLLPGSLALANNLPDPTRPLTVASGTDAIAEQALKLDSILVASSRKLAVINGAPIQEGQRVNGILVRRIGAGAVDVNYQGQNQTLVLVPQVRASGHKAR